MMDRRTSIALVAAGREIRTAVRKLQPLAPGEEAAAILAELGTIAHLVEMLPGSPASTPRRVPRGGQKVWQPSAARPAR